MVENPDQNSSRPRTYAAQAAFPRTALVCCSAERGIPWRFISGWDSQHALTQHDLCGMYAPGPARARTPRNSPAAAPARPSSHPRSGTAAHRHARPRANPSLSSRFSTWLRLSLSGR
jgi:hypothetical protein